MVCKLASWWLVGSHGSCRANAKREPFTSPQGVERHCADAASRNLASDFNGVAEVGDVRTCGGALSGQGGPACLFGIKTYFINVHVLPTR